MSETGQTRLYTIVSEMRWCLIEHLIKRGLRKQMSFLDYFESLKESEHRVAWTVAIAADVLQIAAFPLFVEGAMSPADSMLDLVVAFVMIRLLGWHWAFLPTAAAKLIPGADLFPTWTAAVWFVTRNKVHSGEPEILPPGPAPEPRRGN
jgi:hypothetical protein